MLLQRHKDNSVRRFSVLLGVLTFLIASICFFHPAEVSASAFPPSTSVCTMAPGYAQPEQLSVSVQPVFQKVSQHRIRHKQLKSFLKKTKAEASSCISSSWNITQSFSALPGILIKPGYYLFLFRLTLF